MPGNSVAAYTAGWSWDSKLLVKHHNQSHRTVYAKRPKLTRCRRYKMFKSTGFLKKRKKTVQTRKSHVCVHVNGEVRIDSMSKGSSELPPLASLENFPSLWRSAGGKFDLGQTVTYLNTSQEPPLQILGPGVSSYSGERHSSDSTLKTFVAPPSAASSASSSSSTNSIKRDREPAVAVKAPAAAVVVMPLSAVVSRGPVVVQPASRPAPAPQQGTIVLSKKPRPNAPSVSRSHYQSTTGSNGK